ncbi:hypothetical protein BD410DRAFT_894227 [Rickenella mellea]|uniref:Homeobox domain-containing protein n=1 Tax=Rickenella mellea TaxID=50990 RepID=A0A4Y7QL33_9AGAM|nr:hypothetical protein BD410DRAFT_894227 [Rickenella mellea]
MSPLLIERRDSIASSCSSLSTSTSTSTTSSLALYASTTNAVTRKRMTPAQILSLQRLFDQKSHPSKEERVALALEIGINLKTVSIWFQNRRQSVKRSTSLGQLQRTSSMALRRTRSQTASATFEAPPRRKLTSHMTLDQIASFTELPAPLAKLANTRTPFTLRNINTTKIAPSGCYPGSPTTDRKEGLWNHMPSSPLGPPSSPALDRTRILALPTNSKSFRSLEWACAKARGVKRFDEFEETDGVVQDRENIAAGGKSSDRSMSERCTDFDTDSDEEMEAITPDITSASLPIFNAKPVFGTRDDSKGQSQRVRHASSHRRSVDMDAAMGLLDLMAGR